jgi:hypothetical protein
MFDALQIDAKRIALWAALFFVGAGLAEQMLLQEHEMHAATTVCGHAKLIRIVWSLPGARNGDYSDPSVNVADCAAPHDSSTDEAMLDATANPLHQPTTDEVNDSLRQITADDAAFAKGGN